MTSTEKAVALVGERAICTYVDALTGVEWGDTTLACSAGLTAALFGSGSARHVNSGRTTCF